MVPKVPEKMSEAEFDKKASVFPSYDIAYARLGITPDDIAWEHDSDLSEKPLKRQLKLEGQAVNLRQRSLDLLRVLDHYEVADKHRSEGVFSEADYHDETANELFTRAFGATALIGLGHEIFEFKKKYITHKKTNTDELDRKDKYDQFVDSLNIFIR